MNRTNNFSNIIIAVSALIILIFIFSLSIGRYPIQLTRIPKILTGTSENEIEKAVVLKIRLPRILTAALLGAGLAAAGASFQGMFQNPLISPHILGVASGAGFGGAMAMLFSDSFWSVSLSAFIFGNLAVLISYTLSKIRKTSSSVILILAGIITSTFFSGLISLIKYTADPTDKLPSIIFWLLGSLSTASYRKLLLIFLPILLCIIFLNLIRFRINILSLGDETAKSLGINVEKLKILIILAVTLTVSFSVISAGIIGWIGLIMPHIARFLTGANHNKVIPVSTILGAGYLMLIDDLTRTLTPAEIPLSILTSMMGAVVFILVLKKTYEKGFIDA